MLKPYSPPPGVMVFGGGASGGGGVIRVTQSPEGKGLRMGLVSLKEEEEIRAK